MTYALVWRHDNPSAELMALVQTAQEVLRTSGQATSHVRGTGQSTA